MKKYTTQKTELMKDMLSMKNLRELFTTVLIIGLITLLLVLFPLVQEHLRNIITEEGLKGETMIYINIAIATSIIGIILIWFQSTHKIGATLLIFSIIVLAIIMILFIVYGVKISFPSANSPFIRT